MAFLSRELVERSDFLSSFDVLLDESETGVAKPDPRAYDQAAAAMGLDPPAIVFVDDDPARLLDRFATWEPPALSKWVGRDEA